MLSHLPIFLGLLSLAVPAAAQQVIEYGPYEGALPPAEAGVPYEYSLLPDLNDIPKIKTLFTDYNATFVGSSSGNIPPGLIIEGGTHVFGVPTRPGTYTFQLLLIFTVVDGRQTYTIRAPFNTSIAVRSPTNSALTIEGGALSFNFVEGATVSQSRSIRIVNHGQQVRPLSIVVTSQPRGWLNVSGPSGVNAFSTATISAIANPTGLRAGVYGGSIEITASGGTERFTVPVILSITQAGPAISVSQTGLTFEVQQGSSARLAQSFKVTGSSPAPIAFSTLGTALSGGSWLRVSPAEGNAASSLPSEITASIATDGLAAGEYYGQIEIRANAANNSPRVVNVVLNVLPAATPVAPRVLPAAVVLVQRPGVPVASQSVSVTNVASSTVPVSVGLAFDSGNAGWASAAPTATGAGPGQTIGVDVARVAAVRLAPGVYKANVALDLGDAQRRVTVLLIVPAVPGNNAASQFGATPSPSLAGCTPTKLIPIFTTLNSAFSVTAAWPTALEVQVVDDCGDPVSTGSAVVSFSDGQAPLVLSSTGDGRWGGTWQPKAAAANVVLTADVTSAGPPQLTGSTQLGGTTTPNTTTPVINSGGVVGAAAPFQGDPLAPGSYVSIFGNAMATNLTVASTLPFPTDLGGTQVILGGKRLPLQFAANGQINALVPFDVALNTPQSMVVRRGNVLSTPEQVVVAETQPAVFTKNQSGSGEGIVVGARGDGSQFLVAPGSPATLGEALIIYCTGLGPVTPPVPAGSAAPSNPLAVTISPVTVTVGGKPATLLFAGMAPTFAGLYQVNVLVPAGVTPGSAVELVLTVAGRSSRPVTVAIK